MTAEEKKAARRESHLNKLMVDCKHFRGIQNKLCAAGVNVRELTGGPDSGWAIRMPCLPSMDRATISVTCDKFCAMTREEAENELREEEEATARHIKAMVAAHEDAKQRGFGRGRGGSGEVKCPCCETGNIQYAVASYNGHMHARCTTQNCVTWME